MQQDSTNPQKESPSVVVDVRLESFAMCMICSVEYPPDSTECPNCRVALSLVRRCHSCSRVVSAKHRRCIHCGQAFFPDGQDEFSQQDALDRSVAFRKQRETAKHRNKIRALSISVATFLAVLFVAMLVTQQFTDLTEPSVIATSYALRSAELRRAASLSSSNMGMLAGGELVEITGYSTGEREQRWIVVKWNRQTAYIQADAIAPPKSKDANRGFDVLKFYIASIEDPAVVAEAAKAVTYYCQAFPTASTLGQELRWVLAGRAKQLAARGKSKEELLAEARAQYQLLIDANGEFAQKARVAINAPLPAGERVSHGKREPPVGIVGEQPDTQTITGLSRKPAHELILLEHANIKVRLSRPGTVKDENAIQCSVAQDIRSNERVVIPTGAPCQVKIENLQDKIATLTLAAVIVRNHSYSLHTSTADIRTYPSMQTTTQQVSFRLAAPVAITR